MVSIVSIPHTGTQFTERLLMDMGFEVRCTHVHATHPAQNPESWIDEGGKVVIPWRDPELVRISCENRGVGEIPRPESEWEQLLEWADLPNVHLFQVEPGEVEAKDSEIEKLKNFLGLSFDPQFDPQTDWRPINTSEDVTGQKAAYVKDTRPVVPIASLAP